MAHTPCTRPILYARMNNRCSCGTRTNERDCKRYTERERVWERESALWSRLHSGSHSVNYELSWPSARHVPPLSIPTVRNDTLNDKRTGRQTNRGIKGFIMALENNSANKKYAHTHNISSQLRNIFASNASHWGTCSHSHLIHITHSHIKRTNTPSVQSFSLVCDLDLDKA